MKRRRPRRRVPAGLEHLFWDYPGRVVSFDTDLELVVRRVAGEGGLREMRLLRARVGDAAIRDVIERTRAKGLSPARIRFWQLLLRLPARRANAWVSAARASIWGSRTWSSSGRARLLRRRRSPTDADAAAPLELAGDEKDDQALARKRMLASGQWPLR
jgi:hypothetical protein